MAPTDENEKAGAPMPTGWEVSLIPASFYDFLRREMPEGTVIGNTDWWASRIWREVARNHDYVRTACASPRAPEGSEMMPTLPEPWEGLVEAYGVAKRETGVYEPDRDYRIAVNHTAFEAERALRLALNDLIQQLNG